MQIRTTIGSVFAWCPLWTPAVIPSGHWEGRRRGQRWDPRSQAFILRRQLKEKSSKNYTKGFILASFITRRCVGTIQVGPQGTHHNLCPKAPPRPFHSPPPQINVQFPPSALSLCLWKILQRLKNQTSLSESPLLGRLELLEMDNSWPHTSLALIYAIFVI